MKLAAQLVTRHHVFLEYENVDAAARKIRLRLDSEGAASADLGGGKAAVVPGQPQHSELVRRISAESPGLRMPPVASGLRLSEREIEIFPMISKMKKARVNASYDDDGHVIEILIDYDVFDDDLDYGFDSAFDRVHFQLF